MTLKHTLVLASTLAVTACSAWDMSDVDAATWNAAAASYYYPYTYYNPPQQTYSSSTSSSSGSNCENTDEAARNSNANAPVLDAPCSREQYE